MSKFKAVLFDLDGTLLDTALDFHTALNLLLVEEKMQPMSIDRCRQFVTHGSAGFILGIWGLSDDQPEFKPLQDRLLTFYRQHMCDQTCLFEGLDLLLATLKQRQIPWGIVTNKPTAYAKPVVDQVTPDCAVLICPDDVTKSKPDPEGLFLAAKTMNIAAKDCLYVGDHIRDIQAATAAGMSSIAAAWGYIDHARENAADWNADWLVEHSKDLVTLINQLLDDKTPQTQ